ncbi:MAG: Rnf-Nqr domain containing protein [Eubacteriales bacterium]
MNRFFDLLSVALYTIFIQNLVFSGGYGASEAVRLAAKPRRSFLFAVSIAYFSITTSAACRKLDFIPRVFAFNDAVHAAIFVFMLVLIYLLTAIIMRIFFKTDPKLLSMMGISALNTLVLAIPFINRRASYSFFESIGTGFGAGIAFILAVALMSNGVQKLAKNDEIPNSFKGAPAIFIYVALLSLAFAGFSGSSLFA